MPLEKQSGPRNGAIMARRDEHVAWPHAIGALLASLELAIKCIDRESTLTDAQVHKARKQLKRARSALRLLRLQVGETIYHNENRLIRDAGGSVSPLRDAKALRDVLTSLIRRQRH